MTSSTSLGSSGRVKAMLFTLGAQAHCTTSSGSYIKRVSLGLCAQGSTGTFPIWISLHTVDPGNGFPAGAAAGSSLAPLASLQASVGVPDCSTGPQFNTFETGSPSAWALSFNVRYALLVTTQGNGADTSPFFNWARPASPAFPTPADLNIGYATRTSGVWSASSTANAIQLIIEPDLGP